MADEPEETEVNLRNYETNEIIRPATRADYRLSYAASKVDGGAGVITVDGVRCYVEGEPDCMVYVIDSEIVEYNDFLEAIGNKTPVTLGTSATGQPLEEYHLDSGNFLQVARHPEHSGAVEWEETTISLSEWVVGD